MGLIHTLGDWYKMEMGMEEGGRGDRESGKERFQCGGGSPSHAETRSREEKRFLPKSPDVEGARDHIERA